MMNWFKTYSPKIKESMEYLELFYILKGLSNITPIMTDSVYRIPADPHDIISRCPKSKFSKYKADENDCDDRVRIFRGWMSEKGHGNVLAMDCKIVVPGTGSGTGSHAVIAFLHQGKIIFGEPKLGKIVEYPRAKIKRIIA